MTFPQVCSTCGESYTKKPVGRAVVCSNSFHCCRDCTWVNGECVQRCADHRVKKVDWRTCSDAVLRRAERFYMAYLANSDGLAWDGRPCPTWEQLNDAVRSHWCAVALFAEKDLGGSDA